MRFLEDFNILFNLDWKSYETAFIEQLSKLV